MRHVGSDQAVADANHVLFFNAGEGYQVSHPVTGGDASLVLALSQPLLRELAPAALIDGASDDRLPRPALRIDPRAQALVALLRHSLQQRQHRAAGSREPGADAGVPQPRAAHHARAGRDACAAAAGGSGQGAAGERPGAALDARGDRRRNRRLGGVPDAGVPAGRRPAAVSLSPAPASGARARPASPRYDDCRRWRWISVSPATAISPPRSSRPMAVRRPRSSSRHCAKALDASDALRYRNAKDFDSRPFRANGLLGLPEFAGIYRRVS